MPHNRSHKHKNAKRHDTGYKRLFSHPEFVRDLITGFIPDPWLHALDFTTLERYPDSYITDNLQERKNDIIWRIKSGESWLYLYLLIEFQSTIDPYMAVRVFTYIGLLYQDLIRRKEVLESHRLPPVLPIVLYNGESKWNAAIDIAEQIVPLPNSLEVFRPHLRYLLIEELAYSDADLAALHNLTAAIFRLEKLPSLEGILEIIDTFKIWLDTPEQSELRRSIAIWIRDAINQNPHHASIAAQIDDLQEIRTMLSARIGILIEKKLEEVKQQAIQEIRQEVLEKVRQEVRQEIRQEVRQEIRQEVRQEGLQQGLQQGELRERLRIARSLLDLIVDDKLLAEKTGLSESEVCKLRLTVVPKQ